MQQETFEGNYYTFPISKGVRYCATHCVFSLFRKLFTSTSLGHCMSPPTKSILPGPLYQGAFLASTCRVTKITNKLIRNEILTEPKLPHLVLHQFVTDEQGA